MKTCIEDLARRPEHRAMDSCVVCLLSHGVDGAIYGTDAKLLQVYLINHKVNSIFICFFNYF